MEHPQQVKVAFTGNSHGELDSDFLRLYKNHARQLYCYIRAVIPNQADAEDVFQEVSVALWDNFGQFQSGTNFSAWAMQIARYRILRLRDHNRRNYVRFSDVSLEAIADGALEIPDRLDAVHRVLAQCYQRLSAANRNLVDRRYRGGMSVKALSDQIGRPLRSVYRLLDHVHTVLLECIERNLNKGDSHE